MRGTIQNRWKNAITNIDTATKQHIDSGHKCITAYLQPKLAKQTKSNEPTNKKYNKPSPEQKKDYNERIRKQMKDKKGEDVVRIQIKDKQGNVGWTSS